MSNVTEHYRILIRTMETNLENRNYLGAKVSQGWQDEELTYTEVCTAIRKEAKSRPQSNFESRRNKKFK